MLKRKALRLLAEGVILRRENFARAESQAIGEGFQAMPTLKPNFPALNWRLDHCRALKENYIARVKRLGCPGEGALRAFSQRLEERRSRLAGAERRQSAAGEVERNHSKIKWKSSFFMNKSDMPYAR